MPSWWTRMDVDAIARGHRRTRDRPEASAPSSPSSARSAPSTSPGTRPPRRTLEVYAEALGAEPERGTETGNVTSTLGSGSRLPIAVMRTAVVHDWLNGMRGGEKVLEAILPLVPEPTIFTLFHVPGSVSRGDRAVPDPRLVPEPPALRARGTTATTCRSFPAPSSRSTSPGSTSSSPRPTASPRARSRRRASPHLCYCHTPVRYAYDQFDAYFPRGTTPLCARSRPSPSARLRAWDVATAGRPTRYLANSSAVAERIRRHYGREATVCHPPVDVEFFTARTPSAASDFLLAVGALVPYKRYEDAIEAARRLGRPPRARRDAGPEETRLRALAAPSVQIVRGPRPRGAARALPDLRVLRPAGRGGLRHRGRRGARLRRPGRRALGAEARSTSCATASTASSTPERVRRASPARSSEPRGRASITLPCGRVGAPVCPRALPREFRERGRVSPDTKRRAGSE